MGFRKIKKYFSSKGVLDAVFGRAVLAFGTVKCTPYSMMKYYKSFQYLPDNKAKGINRLWSGSNRSSKRLINQMKL